MYCKYCGKVIDDDSKFCVNCGNNMDNGATAFEDKPNMGFAVLGFFVPIIGLLLYLIYERKQPKRAKSAGKGALTGFIIQMAVCIAIVVLYLSIAFSVVKRTMGSVDINTNRVGFVKETADFDIEFGEFKVSHNGYTYYTSLDVMVTNISNEQKSFFITLEAVDKDGARLGTDMIIVDRLNPNQKIKSEAFKYVSEDKIEQYKTATFKVLDVEKY